MEVNKIYQGDTLKVLKVLPDESVDCIITSPPYYGLRDYGVEGQIGLEKTFEEYLDKMLRITGELKRVLKKTGTLWWNHGDSYNSSPAGNKEIKYGGDGVYGRLMERHTAGGISSVTPKRELKQFPVKSLVLQAHRLAIRMIDEQGWILRNQIIWHKPNCMPSSVKDRFTVDFEPVLFFTKSRKYWFEIQYEKFESNAYDMARMAKAREVHGGKWADNSGGAIKTQRAFVAGNKMGRTKRCIWRINTKPFPEAHFAVFPEALLETPVKAGCPEFVCRGCGKAREKIFSNSEWEKHQSKKMAQQDVPGNPMYRAGHHNDGLPHRSKQKKEIGYTNCNCDAGWNKGIVLDPFMGAGTTGVVARNLGRNWIGIELNPEYIKIAEKRLAAQSLL